MAFGSKDMAIENARHVAVLEAKLEMREERIAELQTEVSELKAMVIRTQDALVAKESPDAWREGKVAEYEANHQPTEEEKEEIRKQRLRAETNALYLENMEQPLFKGAQEMIDILSPIRETPRTSSLHENGES